MKSASDPFHDYGYNKNEEYNPNFLKPTGHFLDEKEMEREQARKVPPRDGRIAVCGSYFAVIGGDGAVRLYDSEASIGERNILNNLK